MNLVERIVDLHRHLESAGIPHAFGGALALAWCTQRARATIDIDVNVFVTTTEVDRVLHSLPTGVVATDQQRAAIVADGQTRLWWETTPVDIFFDTTDFHVAAGRRARIESFGGDHIPFLACRDLAVFKAFFNRTKDWADLEEMHVARTLDLERVLGVLVEYLGAGDERINRLRALGTA